MTTFLLALLSTVAFWSLALGVPAYFGVLLLDRAGFFNAPYDWEADDAR